jgi:hypothetical protein
MGDGHRKRRERDVLITSYDASPAGETWPPSSLERATRGRSAQSRPALAMHKNTAWAACCSPPVEIANSRRALDNRAPSRRYGHQPGEPIGRDRHTRMAVMGSTNV